MRHVFLRHEPRYMTETPIILGIGSANSIHPLRYCDIAYETIWIWLKLSVFLAFTPEPLCCVLCFHSSWVAELTGRRPAPQCAACVWCQWALGLGRCTRRWRALVEVINQSWHLHGNEQSWRAHLSNNSVLQKAIVQYADSNLHNIFARANITTLYIGAECNGIIRPNSSMAVQFEEPGVQSISHVGHGDVSFTIPDWNTQGIKCVTLPMWTWLSPRLWRD